MLLCVGTARPAGVLDRDKIAVRSEPTAGGGKPFNRVRLHLTTVDDGIVRIQAEEFLGVYITAGTRSYEPGEDVATDCREPWRLPGCRSKP